MWGKPFQKNPMLKFTRQLRGGVNQLSPNLATNLSQLLIPHPHQSIIKYEHEMEITESNINTRDT